MTCTAFALTDKVLATPAERPVVVLLAKFNDGKAELPSGIIKEVAMDIELTAIFPLTSLLTIADAVFALVASFASVAPAATLAAVTPPTKLTTVEV